MLVNHDKQLEPTNKPSQAWFLAHFINKPSRAAFRAGLRRAWIKPAQVSLFPALTVPTVMGGAENLLEVALIFIKNCGWDQNMD